MVAKKTKTTKKSSNADKMKKVFNDVKSNVKSNLKKNVKVDKETVKESTSVFMNLLKIIKLQVISGQLIEMVIGIKDILLTPAKFFSSIKEDDRYTQPVATIICFGLIAALIKIILSLGNITLLNTILTVIFTPLILFVLSFALAGMLLMFSFLSKGELSFEKSYKIVASQAFLYPIFILAFHLSFFWTMLVFVSMIADVYILLLAYISCVYGLKAKENLSQLVFGAVLILIVLFYLFTDSSTLWIGARNPELAAQYLHSQFETLLETIKM